MKQSTRADRLDPHPDHAISIVPRTSPACAGHVRDSMRIQSHVLLNPSLFKQRPRKKATRGRVCKLPDSEWRVNPLLIDTTVRAAHPWSFRKGAKDTQSGPAFQ